MEHADVAGHDGVNEGESVDADQKLFERIRRRLEQDADVLRLTDRKSRQWLLYRVALLAAEEAQAAPQPARWESARTRPLATPDLDDPRDVLIGRLARILGAADGGHHAASFDALIGAATRHERYMRADAPGALDVR